jgi:hypothetical protein
LTAENRIEVPLIGVLLSVFLCSATVPCQGALVRMDSEAGYTWPGVLLAGVIISIIILVLLYSKKRAIAADYRREGPAEVRT